MREKNRKPIASIKKLPQFTTMNVIDGQAGLISYFSLIFYSLTIDNILNIVILIILATVTINFAFGEDGIIARAQQAKEITEQATKDEQEALNSLIDQYDSIISGNGTTPEEPEEPKTPIEEIKGQIQDDTLKVENVPIDSDGENPDATGTIYVPGGFGIDEDSPNDINDGIVISSADDSQQFVWIPVSSEELGEMYVEAPGTELSSNAEEGFEVTVTTDVYSKFRIDGTGEVGDTNIYKPGTNAEREPDILTSTYTYEGMEGDATVSNLGIIKNMFATELAQYGISSSSSDAQVLNAWAQMLVDEYNETYESIKQYGGFYIGRYEISGSVESPTVVQGGTVLTADDESAGNWYNLKKACNNVVNNDKVKSEMIYGNQWDRVLNWLVETGAKEQDEVYSNSNSWGNYSDSTGEAATDSGSPQTSRKNEAWQANNIYDLAGNYMEWTQEASYTSFRIVRGRSLLRFRFRLSSFSP